MIITNHKGRIEFYVSSTEVHTVPKVGFYTKIISATSLEIYSFEHKDNAVLTIDYTTVTSPIVSSVQALSDLLILYCEQPIDVILSDHISPAVIAYFCLTHKSTTLTAKPVLHSRIINVADPGITMKGCYVSLFSPADLRFSFFFVTEVNGNAITLDSPIDFEYPIGSYVDISITNLAVDGSVTPKVFGLRGLGNPPGVDLQVDITKIIFTCITKYEPEFEMFGDIPRLTNGILIRKRDGVTNNIVNIKSNEDMMSLMFSWTRISDSLFGMTKKGFYSELAFAGQENLGIAQRLYLGEDLEVVIQDDLTGLDKLMIVAQGHIVD